MNHESIYTRVEFERRFLVPPDSDWRGQVEPYSKNLEDKYIRNSNLRLRVMTDNDTGRRIIKLTKKVASETPFATRISRILLSETELALFNSMEGDHLKKTRFYHCHLGRVFSIDVYEGNLDGLLLCETESESLEDLMSAQPPPYVKEEVTVDPFFTGGHLCRCTQSDLLSRLTSLPTTIPEWK